MGEKSPEEEDTERYSLRKMAVLMVPGAPGALEQVLPQTKRMMMMMMMMMVQE